MANATVEQYLSSKPDMNFSYEFLSLYEIDKDENVAVITYNLLNDYYSDIKKTAIPVELTEEQYQEWKYCPEVMCRYLYKNPNIYFIVLALNNMASAKEFNKKIIKLPHVDTMKKIISMIVSSEKNVKLKNIQKIK